MKKLILSMASLVLLTLVFATPARADLCYICEGGSYVKVNGSDTQDKRKAAKACGCKITGTRGSCDAANLKVLCTVKKPVDEKLKVAGR